MAEITTLTTEKIKFVRNHFSEFDETNAIAEIAGRAASQRSFIRIRQGATAFILVEWDSSDEDWKRFLSIGGDRSTTSGLLPEIYSFDEPAGFILEEDLGKVTLKKYCADINYNPAPMLQLYKRVIDALVIWHSPVVSRNSTIASRLMDTDTFAWETAYFGRHCVEDYCGYRELLTGEWDSERMRMAAECVALSQTAIHRDFQSENVMVHDGSIRFVDFQGARLGPPEYDLASLLYDPYISSIDDDLRADVYRYYLSLKEMPARFPSKKLLLCAAQRLMQALGAYSNLVLNKEKKWYEAYIPIALERLQLVLCQLGEFPHLLEISRRCSKRVADTIPLDAKGQML